MAVRTQEARGDGGDVHYLDCVDGFTVVDIC